jgi:hypothetical protein
MAGRTSLVKSVIASQAIYHFMSLKIVLGTLKFINKIERAFLLTAKETITSAKCMVNWDSICRPKEYGGLGVLYLGKFTMALRLCWPWLQWNDPRKIWVDSGTPCNEEDLSLFYATTSITVGNGCSTPFWHAPWLDGIMPKDIAPKIFVLEIY